SRINPPGTLSFGRA
ncbi:unnamed protein product, partial [Adineta steineri]